MTVQHLKNLKNQQNTGKSNSSFPELFASDSNFMIMMGVSGHFAVVMSQINKKVMPEF